MRERDEVRLGAALLHHGARRGLTRLAHLLLEGVVREAAQIAIARLRPAHHFGDVIAELRAPDEVALLLDVMQRGALLGDFAPRPLRERVHDLEPIDGALELALVHEGVFVVPPLRALGHVGLEGGDLFPGRGETGHRELWEREEGGRK